MSGIIYKNKWLYILVGILILTSCLCIFSYTNQSEDIAKKIINYSQESNIDGLISLACDEGDIISDSRDARARALYDSLKSTSRLGYIVKDRFPYTNIYLVNNDTKNNLAYIVITYQFKTNSFCFYRGVL